MRLIDADDFAERMLKQWDTADEEKKTEIIAVIANIVTPILTSTPTADVKPVRHGKWIVGDDSTYCNNCGKKPIPDIDYDLFWQPDYCPNCGSYNGGENEYTETN